MRDDNLHRAVWRWHFFAGAIVLPFLAWMAVTGALYLYKGEIELALYSDWIVSRSDAPPLPASAMIRLVEEKTAGKVSQLIKPANPGESWRMTFARADGVERLAFVRPDTGEVLGISRAGGPLDLVKRLHSLSVAGTAGNILVEIVAGWAILLVLTGLYLWWPRAGSRALTLAGRVGEHRFWRNLHASTGAIAGALILFLAITGMPWTTFWGAQFHAFVARQEIGRPKAPGPGGGHDSHLPWSLQGHASPLASGKADLGPDSAIAAARARGLSGTWVLDLPANPGQPYRIAAASERTGDVRLLYIDPSDAKVLQDVGYADFGLGAKVFEWGIATHQGRQYGEANRLAMLGACIALLLMCASAPVMWWKRRRQTGSTAPPSGGRSARTRGVFAVMLALGALFPLTGLTLFAAWIGSGIAGRLRRSPG